MTIEEIIDALIESDIDGETTQYILEQIGMDVQMAIQLTNKYPSVVQERLNELKSEGLI
jgi:signal recognition particle GTPase